MTTYSPPEISECSSEIAIIIPFIHGMVFLVHDAPPEASDVTIDQSYPPEHASSGKLSFLFSDLHSPLPLKHATRLSSIKQTLIDYAAAKGLSLLQSSPEIGDSKPSHDNDLVYETAGSSGRHSLTDPLFECAFRLQDSFFSHLNVPTSLRERYSNATARLSMYDFGAGTVSISRKDSKYNSPHPEHISTSESDTTALLQLVKTLIVSPVVAIIEGAFRNLRSHALEESIFFRTSLHEAKREARLLDPIVPWSHLVRLEKTGDLIENEFEIKFGESLVADSLRDNIDDQNACICLLERAQAFYLACLTTNQALSAIEARLLERLSSNDFKSCAKMQQPTLLVERWSRFLISRIHLYETMLHPKMRARWASMIESWDFLRLEQDIDRQSSALSESSRAIGSVVQSRSSQLFSVFFFIVTIIGILSITTSVLGFEFSSDKVAFPNIALIIAPIIGFFVLSTITIFVTRLFLRSISI